MRNIRDIRTEECKYYILSSDLSGSSPLKKIAIVINLYYEDLLKREYVYIDRLPFEVDVFLITSQETLFTELNERYKEYDNFTILRKENRGRDLSALLVCFKAYWEHYDYICFLHDKKTSFVPEYVRPDIDFWVKNLWMNSIGSYEFIKNVIIEFEKDERLGLLVPPEPEGLYTSEWSRPRWYEGDYENVEKLAAELGVASNISKSKPAFTLGSVFWCRKEALRKLFDYDWKYEDFPDEPMPSGGTISHAIERIIGYVAQDAGYSVGTVMSTSYASEFFSFLQNNINKMMWCLHNDGKPTEFAYYDNIYADERGLINYLDEHSRLFIYGAGQIGKSLENRIRRWGYKVEKFIVTDNRQPYDNAINLEDYVYELGDGIIVAVSEKYIPEIKKELFDRSVSDYFVF